MPAAMGAQINTRGAVTLQGGAGAAATLQAHLHHRASDSMGVRETSDERINTAGAVRWRSTPYAGALGNPGKHVQIQS